MQAMGFPKPCFPHLRNRTKRPSSDSAWVKDTSVQELQAGEPLQTSTVVTADLGVAGETGEGMRLSWKAAGSCIHQAV